MRRLLLKPWVRAALTLLLVLVAALCAKIWYDTMRDPVVQRTSVALPDYPADAAPVMVALISDIHVAGPDMPPSRLEGIVERINALEPDMVLIAGDLVSHGRFVTHIYEPSEIIAPLGGLRAPLGVFAVPGNHDHWFDMPALASEMRRQGVTLLANEAAQSGPLVIGGLDDDYTGRADIPKTLAAMADLQGGRVMLSHSPDPFPDLPRSVPLVLSGHTHCGQIVWPWGEAEKTSSRYGNRFACGRIDEGGRSVIVGAGLGTSILPIRLFTHPEIWLVTIGPSGG